MTYRELIDRDSKGFEIQKMRVVSFTDGCRFAPSLRFFMILTGRPSGYRGNSQNSQLLGYVSEQATFQGLGPGTITMEPSSTTVSLISTHTPRRKKIA